MNVIPDTPIWSAALRKPHKKDTEPYVKELEELIKENRIILLGGIRQEILSGIKEKEYFEKLKGHLKAFEDFPVTSEDYEYAAEIFNTCRSKGVQGSNTDFLICAISIRHGISIFTTDKDFGLYSKHIKIHLHTERT